MPVKLLAASQFHVIELTRPLAFRHRRSVKPVHFFLLTADFSHHVCPCCGKPAKAMVVWGKAY